MSSLYKEYAQQLATIPEGPNPLDVACPHCDAKADFRCGHGRITTHKARYKAVGIDKPTLHDTRREFYEGELRRKQLKPFSTTGLPKAIWSRNLPSHHNPKNNSTERPIMQNFARELSNQEISDIIQALDRINNPNNRRMEGDDEAIVKLMEKLNLKQTIVDKLLIGYVIAREATSRGLQIARPNEPIATTEHEEEFSPSLARR